MTRNSALERLPIELKQQILHFLPDIASLRSTILTCSSFYHAFADAEVLITTDVVTSQIGLEVLPEAIAALQSSRLQPWTRERIQEFVHDQLHSRKTQLPSLTLSDGLALDSLHRHVKNFAAAFATQALAKSSVLGDLDSIPDYPPSRNEIHRIQRAFCRFEMYCNLFRDPKRTLFHIDEQRDLLFLNFSPWENEQLGCIHDFLFRVVSPGMGSAACRQFPKLILQTFNDIAEHDVDWGELEVHCAFDYDSVYIQHLLSLGLARLHEIAAAETYDERHRLINAIHPGFNFEFLHEGLSRSNEHDYSRYLADFTASDEERFARDHAPFVREPDTGPKDAWRWAHQYETPAGFVFTELERPLREQGYCFWDRSRLDDWGLFRILWKPPVRCPSTHAEEEVRRAEMRYTFLRRRSQIHWQGGSGWWSVGDESKVVWPEGSNPYTPGLTKKRSWGLKYG